MDNSVVRNHLFKSNAATRSMTKLLDYKNITRQNCRLQVILSHCITKKRAESSTQPACAIE